jgi:hypothetical protein
MTNAAPVIALDSGRKSRSGLVYLRDTVATYFQLNEIAATVAKVGKKYRFVKLNADRDTSANRLVFIPGEFDGEDKPKPRAYGSLSRATDNSASVVNPPEIMHWDRTFTLSIWAPPKLGDTSDEESAHEIIENLFEQVLRATQTLADPTLDPDLAGVPSPIPASIRWGDITIMDPPGEKTFGIEWLVQGVMLSPFFGQAMATVFPTAVVPRTGA